MTVLLGIDIGTSSIKSMIMDPLGSVLGFSQVEYNIEIPHTGYAEQHPYVWWDLVCRTIEEAMKQANVSGNNIAGVGLSGQMHGLVALDKDANVLHPAIIWCDQRSIRQKEWLETQFSQEQLGRLIQNSVATGFQLSSLQWLKEHKMDIYNKISKVISPKDYIRFRLTGVIEGDSTDASGTSFYHVAAKHWSEQLLAQIGIDISLFPAIGEPWEVSGEVNAKASLETKLKKGTPVAYGGGDQAMQAIGNGIIHPGLVSCTLGTGGQLLTPLTKPIYDPKLRTHTFVHAVPDRWYLMGASMSAGLSLKWLATKILKKQDYHELDEMASKVNPGSDGILFLPYLAGDRTPHMDPSAKAMFFGLTLQHQDAHLIRAVLEGVAFSLRDSLEIFKELGVETKKLILSGGGAKSKLWNQIITDILGQDAYSSMMQEQACVGAALVAGVAANIYESVEHACTKVVKICETPITPNDQNKDIYSHYYALYRKLYEHNKDLFPGANYQD
ncbi:xylulokinase [Paenibacillus pectinilyticus]|uniref:Xylulose kinase n=1 Tax=Paenibacillus pectinilyticus TaxID=512399 RepID=A0A1C1A3C0_9BACL|nr:xylulokinase [Paenibacillus pectinilyticus]OCT15059.1 xylulokinase [Paenibacillus pectinilyticus]